MTTELEILLLTAASVALIHTLIGPDHYVPFIAMAKARKWSVLKTASVTISCGLGHVLSSVVIGMLGVAAGAAIGHVKSLESVRGELAAWALIAFGLVYGVWGLRKALRNRPHVHGHAHENEEHNHEHTHAHGHAHVHGEAAGRSMTPWVLFTVFVLGPCEPLIPILMYPAARQSTFGLVAVTVVFGVVTISAMTGMVLAVSAGLNRIPFGQLERYTHALAGATIALSGLAIKFLGL